jgi:hypothetical protein
MEDTSITIDYVKSLTKPTDKFLCTLSDNTYNIKFLSFRVRDMDSGFVLFEVEDSDEVNESTETISDEARVIKYHLGPDFLDLNNLGTNLTFRVGSTPVKNLQMIERHYFKDRLIKSFEFKFDFCIPNSTNNWETIYNIPQLEEELKSEMIASPWQTISDSFYFADGRLIMHHKAYYNYSDV